MWHNEKTFKHFPKDLKLAIICVKLSLSQYPGAIELREAIII